MAFHPVSATENLGPAIGRWLRGLRAVRGLSSGSLAARAGLDPARVEAIEGGRGAPPDLGELTALISAIDPSLLGRLVEFALTVGAAAETLDDANELSHLGSRIVAAFGQVTSPATRNAVAELIETVAGYGASRRLHA